MKRKLLSLERWPKPPNGLGWSTKLSPKHMIITISLYLMLVWVERPKLSKTLCGRPPLRHTSAKKHRLGPPNKPITSLDWLTQTYRTCMTYPMKFWGQFVSCTSPWGSHETPWAQGDPGVTPMTCGAVGEKALVILVWVRALGVGNASHPWRLGGTRVRPWAIRSLWHVDFIMLKNTSIGGVRLIFIVSYVPARNYLVALMLRHRCEKSIVIH